jgi:hypothetical protein
MILTILASSIPIALGDAAQSSVQADLWRERFIRTDSDSINFDASLAGAYRWSLGMDSVEATFPIISAPQISITTQYNQSRFYFDPAPSVASCAGEPELCKYNWTFSDIASGGYGADTYIESDLPVTFSPGFDSERTVSPLLLFSDQVNQTVTVHVTPREEYQRIQVAIYADTTDLTNGTLVTGSATLTPEPAGGCDFEAGVGYDAYVSWNCPNVQVATTYTFTAEFQINNNAYPTIVENKPRVVVRGQRILDDRSDILQGSSLTVTDDVLGDVTYSANGNYSWNYFARDRWVVIYRPIALPLSVAGLQGFTSAPTNSTLLVVGDIAINKHGSKPPGVGYQQGRDTTPLGFVSGMLDFEQPKKFDTNAAWIGSDGRPLSSIPQTLIFSIGGSDINAVTHYYEHTDVTADRAPVTWSEEGSDVIWRYPNGTVVVNVTQASTNVPPGTSDVFAIQILRDADGRLVVLMYGERYTGTWAAAEYFKFIVYPNIVTYTDSYYIVRWTDALSGPDADFIPGAGDTFEIIAQGTR